jgi:phospholipase C
MLRLAVAAASIAGSTAAAAEERVEAITRLKGELHRLEPAEADARIAALAQTAGPPPPRQEKIDHFVVLFMENQASDVFSGCMDLPGLDSIRNATIPKDPTNPSGAPAFCVPSLLRRFAARRHKVQMSDTRLSVVSAGGSHTFKCQKEYICSEGPSYDAEAPADGTDDVIPAFGPEQIPVKVEIAKQFGFFNRLYTSVPAASSPNHLFAQTATSCGIVSNIPYKECGGSQAFFPPLSIYDSMTLHNVSFGIYYNTTCNTTKDHGSCYGPNSPEPTRGGTVSQYYGPDVNIDGVWRYRAKFQGHEKFYEAAAAGTLPQFSWISPSQQASDHPCNDIRKGERQLKDIYEAVRAGPKWSKTLLLVVYDDYGGAYDHVIPPAEWRTVDHMGKPREGKAVPADDAPCHLLDQCSSGPYVR